MASIKNLKKHITNVCGELYTECSMIQLFSENMHQEKADAILAEIIRTEDNFVKRAGNPNGKENKNIIKKYYKKIHSDFIEKTDQLIKDINALAK